MKSLDTKIEELERIISRHKQRLNEIDDLIKRLFEKYVNGKIAEDKFYALDRSYDVEKIELIRLERDNEAKVLHFKNEVNEINAFFELISAYDIITDLKSEHIARLIDKIVVHEKKSKFNKRIVEVYFVFIGKI